MCAIGMMYGVVWYGMVQAYCSYGPSPFVEIKRALEGAQSPFIQRMLDFTNSKYLLKEKEGKILSYK